MMLADYEPLFTGPLERASLCGCGRQAVVYTDRKLCFGCGVQDALRNDSEARAMAILVVDSMRKARQG